MTAPVGVLQRLELLGNPFEIQTELVDPAALKVRTVIFHRGRVLAVREARLSAGVDADADGEQLAAAVRRAHDYVTQGFIKRTQGFEQRLAGGAPPAAAAPGAARSEPASGDVELPPIPDDPALADSIDVRKLFAQLRIKIESRGEAAVGSDHWERLDRARAALGWAVDQPLFNRVRIDEQVRCQLVRDRISAWDSAGRNPDEAEWIWTEVVVLCDYMSEVNMRAELLDFDRRLVAWALAALERGSSSPQSLKPLRWLEGRDREVDRLLASPTAVPAEAWTMHLCRVWSALQAER